MFCLNMPAFDSFQDQLNACEPYRCDWKSLEITIESVIVELPSSEHMEPHNWNTVSQETTGIALVYQAR